MSEKIKAKIVKALNVKPGNGETPESYHERVMKKIAKLKNDEWDSLLDNPEQVWINEQITRGNNIKDAKAAKEEYAGEPVDYLIPPNASEDQEDHDDGEPGGEPTSDEDVGAESDEADAASEDDDETQEEEADVLHASESSKSKKASGKSTKKAAAKPAKKEAAPKKDAAPKAKKAAAKKKTPSGENRGRKAMFGPDQKITPLVKENPHREGTKRWKRWSKYRPGMSVQDALDAGFDMNNLRFSVKDKHIAIR